MKKKKGEAVWTIIDKMHYEIYTVEVLKNAMKQENGSEE